MPQHTVVPGTAQLPLFGEPSPPAGLVAAPATIPGAPPEPESAPSAADSLGAAIRAYCQHLAESRRAAHTVRSTELDLHALVEHLGDVTVRAVTAEHLADHLRALRTERRNGVSSLRRKIATLKGFFRYAAAHGWHPSDPSAPLAYPPPARQPVIALTPEELDAVVGQAAHDPAWHALILLLADAGLKRDELLALRADDLHLARDPAQSQVTIRRTSAANRLRRRTIALPSRAHEALSRLLTAPLPGERLFTLSVRGVNFVVETVGRRAGITRLKKLTPEVLRDTYAVRQMRARLAIEGARAAEGMDPTDLARLQREHDHEVLQLLGLSRYSDMAVRYRAAALRMAGTQ